MELEYSIVKYRTPISCDKVAIAMKRIMKSCALAATMAVASGAFANDILYTGPVKQVRPEKAIEIKKWSRNADGSIHIIEKGRVIDMTGEVRPASVITAPAYDGLEFDPATIGTSMSPTDNPTYGGNCGIAVGSRFFSGTTIFDGGYMSEINAIAGTSGKLCNRLGYEWYTFSTPINQMAAIIFVSDNFVDGPSAIDPNQAANRVDLGTIWLITYTAGAIAGGSAYLGDIDFGLGTNGWQMPTDGRGALSIINGDYDGTNVILGCGQQMRWVIKTGNPTPADYGNCWRDRLLFNGLWDGVWNAAASNEFESRTTTACSGLVKAGRVSGAPCTSICASMLFAPPAVLTATAFNVLLGSVAAGGVPELQAIDGDTTNANKLKLCKALVPTLTSPKVRVDFDFTSPYLAATAVSMNVNANMTNGGSFAIRGFVADRTGGGFVYGVANQAIADTPILLSGNNGQNFSGNSPQPTLNIHTDGTMRARVEIQQTGLSPVAVPCVAIDYIGLTVTP